MKRTLLVAAAGLAVGLFALIPPQDAAAQDAGGLPEWCRDFMEEHPDAYRNLGECLSDPVRMCRRCRQGGLFPMELVGATVRNQGECVAYLRRRGTIGD